MIETDIYAVRKHVAASAKMVTEMSEEHGVTQKSTDLLM